MKNRKAFTLVELVFVIVIIGILSAIAIPRLAGTRNSAEITKARSTIGSVRNAIATERQKRILRGEFQAVTSVAAATGLGQPIFDTFNATLTDPGGVPSTVLLYPLTSCLIPTSRACWIATAGPVYTYRVPASSINVTFTVNNNFNCTAASSACSLLE